MPLFFVNKTVLLLFFFYSKIFGYSKQADKPMRGLFCIFRLRMYNAASVMMIFSCTSIIRLDNRFPVWNTLSFALFVKKKTRRFCLKEVYIWLVVVRILHVMLLITGLFRFFGILHDMLTWWILLVNGCTIAILLVTENS